MSTRGVDQDQLLGSLVGLSRLGFCFAPLVLCLSCSSNEPFVNLAFVNKIPVKKKRVALEMLLAVVSLFKHWSFNTERFFLYL